MREVERMQHGATRIRLLVLSRLSLAVSPSFASSVVLSDKPASFLSRDPQSAFGAYASQRRRRGKEQGLFPAPTPACSTGQRAGLLLVHTRVEVMYGSVDIPAFLAQSERADVSASIRNMNSSMSWFVDHTYYPTLSIFSPTSHATPWHCGVRTHQPDNFLVESKSFICEATLNPRCS